MVPLTHPYTVGHTDAYHSLAKKRPAGSLVSAANIIGLLLHVAIVALVQIVTFFWLTEQTWLVGVV